MTAVCAEDVTEALDYRRSRAPRSVSSPESARITAQAFDQPNQSTHASPRRSWQSCCGVRAKDSRDHHASSLAWTALQLMYAQAAGVAGASPR